MIRIRLRRVGKKRHPYYRVVVANKMGKRDGAFLETLGSYDPHVDPPLVSLDEAKTREWLGKGAQPSEAAEKILRRAGIAVLAAPKDAGEVASEALEAAPTRKATRAATKATAPTKAPAAPPKAKAAPKAANEPASTPAEAAVTAEEA
jgi:small subunit ribosomal protein S16